MFHTWDELNFEGQQARSLLGVALEYPELFLTLSDEAATVHIDDYRIVQQPEPDSWIVSLDGQAQASFQRCLDGVAFVVVQLTHRRMLGFFLENNLGVPNDEITTSEKEAPHE